MKGLVLAQTDLLLFPLISVVLFVLIFSAAVLWVFRSGSKERYERDSALVFDDGSEQISPHTDTPHTHTTSQHPREVSHV
jgi:cbb3-type cytochrome oxidase subunit 3